MQENLLPARRAWLLVIALGHLAVLMAWRPIAWHASEATPGAHGELVFLNLPPARRSDAVEQAPPPKPAQHARQARGGRPAPPPPASDGALPDAPAASEANAQAITPPASSSLPPDPFAKPAGPAETLLARARMSAAGIDRQLRKESLNKFATIIQPDTKLGMAIAKSQNKEWVLEQTSDVGDGVVMRRYRKGNMELCEYTNLVGARGQDPFRDGNKTKVMTCP